MTTIYLPTFFTELVEILPCVQVLAGVEWFGFSGSMGFRWEPRVVGFSEGLALALALVMGASVFGLGVSRRIEGVMAQGRGGGVWRLS
jgi:hypothetical protein